MQKSSTSCIFVYMNYLAQRSNQARSPWRHFVRFVVVCHVKSLVRLSHVCLACFHTPTVQKSWPGTRLPEQKSCDVTASSAVSHGTRRQAGVWGHKETSSGRPAAIGRFPSCAALPLLERAAEAAALSSAALWRLAVHITAWLMCGLKQFSEEDGTLFSRKGMHTSESLTRHANTGRCLWISPARWLF